MRGKACRLSSRSGARSLLTAEPGRWAPLAGVQIVSAAVNLPALAVGFRLTELGATVTKVEPPAGDQTEAVSPRLYAVLTARQEIVRLDLKDAGGRALLYERLAHADVLVTASRPAALERMGLASPRADAGNPELLHVALIGHPHPRQDSAGHDLTYIAESGLAAPPALPPTLVADLGGAERAVTAVLGLLLGRRRGNPKQDVQVSLAESADFFSLPRRYGLTGSAGALGGASPYYRFYEAADGWVALAALEPKFRRTLADALLGPDGDPQRLAQIFATRSAAHWHTWAAEHDVPLVAVHQDDQSFG
jgi:alpha-methylacyl-CoA racemase